ncbi:hypothetical protein [Haloparvum sp. PAK95]|uniref:hypothetical protein n=1 Tax=Haloparvum sp. PAK95 TaxID=3418962 RepID=UPI003D2EFD54
MKPANRAYGAAIVTSFIAFAASLYFVGVPARFPVFFLRSLTVIFLVFALTVMAVDRITLTSSIWDR